MTTFRHVYKNRQMSLSKTLSDWMLFTHLSRMMSMFILPSLTIFENDQKLEVGTAWVWAEGL